MDAAGPVLPSTRRGRATSYLRGLDPRWIVDRRPAFVVFAQGRTGSTLLGDLLATHPDVVFEDEILAEPVAAPTAWVLGRRAHHPGRVFGFHVKWYQLQLDQGVADCGAFLRRLSRARFRVIFLHRENIVRQALSTIIAAHSGRWHQRGSSSGPPPKPEVDVDELFSRIAERVAGGRLEERALSEVPHTTVTYERDLLDPAARQGTADRLFELLGLAPVPVSTGLLRTGSDRLEDQIANAEEVASALAGTPWARFLTAG